MTLPYSESSVFLVPLRDKGYGRGIVARHSKRGGIVFGYFWAPRLTSANNVSLTDLNPESAILKRRFGDLGLVNREWPVIGRLPEWSRSKWPMHPFLRLDPISSNAWEVRYDEDDLAKIIDEYPASTKAQLVPNMLAGYGALEIMLTDLLATE